MPSELFFNVYSLVSHFGVFTLKFLLIKNFNFGKIHTYNICYLNSVQLSNVKYIHIVTQPIFGTFFLSYKNQTRPIKQELVTPPSPEPLVTIILSVSEFD